jgi:outer membrane protein TolC
MDAQRTWYDAQQSYNDALLAFERSGAKVMYSLGLSL